MSDGLVLPVAAVAAPARIGPNAIWRVAEALDHAGEPALAARVFGAAGLAHYLRAMPDAMVDERDVTALHRALRGELGVAAARRIGRDAGVRTAGYLLARRIPRPFQVLLRRLPPAMGGPLLMTAIGRHAWTFAGSGRFSWRRRSGGLEFAIAGCPLCRGERSTVPLCDYYAGTFEALLRALVSAPAQVAQSGCGAAGDPDCRFVARW